MREGKGREGEREWEGGGKGRGEEKVRDPQGLVDTPMFQILGNTLQSMSTYYVCVINLTVQNLNELNFKVQQHCTLLAIVISWLIYIGICNIMVCANYRSVTDHTVTLQYNKGTLDHTVTLPFIGLKVHVGPQCN